MSAPVLVFTNKRVNGRVARRPAAQSTQRENRVPPIAQKAAQLAVVRPAIAGALERMIDKFLAETDRYDFESDGAR